MDLPGAERLAERDELAPGGEDRHARPPRHRHKLDADGGEQADLRGAEPGAARDDEVAGGDVFSGAAHVGAGPRRLPYPQQVAGLLRVLHLHHGVGARRERRAGHDLRRLTGLEPGIPPQAGRDVDDDRELAAARLELRAAHRVAVHRRVVERGDGLGRDDVVSRGAAERGPQRDLLAGQR